MMKAFKADNVGADLGFIGQGIEISGQVQFNDRLQVDGKITGKVTSENGVLTIGESGLIEAQIDVGTCIIYGRVEGDLSSSSRIEIRKTGRVHGDVITPSLLIEEGAILNGVVKMTVEQQRQQHQDPAESSMLPDEEKEKRKVKFIS
jgi:cytoskeletal protein CcmA (bactofilin family)